ncbi:MAG: rhomboid family intramembrane serine protease [Bryobacter sp.]|jgi:membrane associated rhomboid family serine protease|nr:rhomboid family intramembrane serine protease [Bryobacter sp.]
MIPLRDSNPSHTTPLVTFALIFVNVAVFLYEISLSDIELNHFVTHYGVIAARLSYVDLITSMFLHGGWMHLIGNMWFLWIFGDNVEDILGRAKYLLLYLASGVAASLIQVAFNPDSRIPLVGASGAIAGVMGAYLLKFPHARILMLFPIFIFFTTIEVNAVFVLLYWLVIQFFSGVGSLAQAPGRGGVAFWAHVGGFFAGMLLISILKTQDRYRRHREYYWR